VRYFLQSHAKILLELMALVVHYDLELHQMNIKTTFLNGDLYENVYMAQPKGFIME
jgi:hypothetical protein